MILYSPSLLHCPPQVKNPTDVTGQNVNGGSRDRTSSPDTTGSTREPSPSNARCVSAPSPAPTTSHSTWSATCPSRRNSESKPESELEFAKLDFGFGFVGFVACVKMFVIIIVVVFFFFFTNNIAYSAVKWKVNINILLRINPNVWQEIRKKQKQNIIRI